MNREQIITALQGALVAIDAQRAIVRDILIKVQHGPSEPVVEPHMERYLSPCPAGYDTVLGYLAKTNPEALDLMDQEAEATTRDGWKLTAMARQEGVEVVKVRACPFLEAQGIFEVNAYPVRLLRRRLGA